MEIYINTPGTYLHVKDELFEIKVKEEKHQVAVHKVKSILLTESAAISTSAIKLALKNNIDIVMLDYNGQPIGRFWHCKLGSTTKIRKAQLHASIGKLGVTHTKTWIAQKLQNQMDFIKNLKKHRAEKHGEFLQDKIERITNLQTSINELEGEVTQDIADTLRGLEGTAGRLYFQTLSHVLPPTYQFKGRSFRPAKNPFNAFLNYAYGVLYGKIEKALIIAGIDPYLGFLHRDDYNQKSMVYDFIEPYRTFADKVVFQLFSAKKVNKAHTDEITNGFKLNKDGKVLLIEKLNHHLEADKIRYKNRNQTRANIIQFDAHEFANSLIKS